MTEHERLSEAVESPEPSRARTGTAEGQIHMTGRELPFSLRKTCSSSTQQGWRLMLEMHTAKIGRPDDTTDLRAC